MSPGALDGVRVLDLTRYIPGPYCTMLLGDLGADVTKVEEPPFGDATRGVPPAPGGESAVFAALNRNKRSILLDLRHVEGAALVRRLAAGADVLVESYRPGVMARRGLDAEGLCRDNPRLVYCSVTGYGPDGPLADRAGHDIDYLARSGFLGGAEDVRLPPTQLADMAGGMVAALGVLAALHARERTGRGQVVDASMLGGMLGLMTVPAARRLAGADDAGELAGGYACYDVYRCRDGRHLAVGALEPRFWEGLCRALGLEGHVAHQWSRRRAGEIRQAFADAFARRDRDAWLETLAPLDVCVEPVLDLDEALHQPGVAGEWIAEEPRAGARFRTLASPVRLRDTPAVTRRPAPEPGAHTDELLAEAGLDAGEIARLRQAGVVS